MSQFYLCKPKLHLVKPKLNLKLIISSTSEPPVKETRTHHKVWTQTDSHRRRQQYKYSQSQSEVTVPSCSPCSGPIMVHIVHI